MVKKIKLTPKNISNMLALIMVIIIIFIIIYLSQYLYINFYLTLTQADEISLDEIKISSYNNVEVEKFNAIIEKIVEKTSPQEPAEITNPFR